MRDDMDQGESQGHTDEARNPTRRALLGAAGGFALAASGLLLPGRLVEDAEADSNPVRRLQQRKNQRRKKARNRKHSRNRRRTHGKKRGFALIDGIRWGYYSEAGPFDVQFWARANAGRSWGIISSQHIPNDNFVELKTTDVIGILWINERYFLRAENFLGAVHLTLGHGGTFTNNHGWENGTDFIRDYDLKVRALAPDMIVDGFKFTVERLEDDDDYKKLSLSIRKA
jgi:hypothetical protein